MTGTRMLRAYGGPKDGECLPLREGAWEVAVFAPKKPTVWDDPLDKMPREERYSAERFAVSFCGHGSPTYCLMNGCDPDRQLWQGFALVHYGDRPRQRLRVERELTSAAAVCQLLANTWRTPLTRPPGLVARLIRRLTDRYGRS